MIARRRTQVAAVLLTLGMFAGCGASDDTDLTATDEATESEATESEATAEESPPESPETTAETGTAETSPPEQSEPTEEGNGQDSGNRTSKNITLTKPAEGATVSGSFTAAGKANSFEANVLWELRDADDTVVKEGYAMAEGWMDKLYPWKKRIDVSGLEPGEYLFVAMTEDPSGGNEGDGPEMVSTSITVE